MGGRRLTAGASVEALSEAIDIIRGTWDADNAASLRVEGDYYHVKGAKRGAPAHDIGIWLGAYKPRMLRLTGLRPKLRALCGRRAGYRRKHRVAARFRHTGFGAALATTDYGSVLLIKIVIVAAAVLAVFLRRRRLEFGVVIAILAAATLLGALPPPR